MKFATLGVWPVETYSPNFVNWSGGPVIPCGNMHQSFTRTLVKLFFHNFPTFADSFNVLSIHCVARRLGASRGGSRRQHGLLVNFTIAYCCDLFIVVQTCWRSIVNGCQSRVIRLSLRSGHLTDSYRDQDVCVGRCYFNTFTFCAYSTLECSWSRQWWWLQLSSAWS